MLKWRRYATLRSRFVSGAWPLRTIPAPSASRPQAASAPLLIE
jgi:hypothetical protein